MARAWGRRRESQRFLDHRDESSRTLARTQAAPLAVIVIEHIVRSVTGDARGLYHRIVRTQVPAVVAGQAITTGKATGGFVAGRAGIQAGFDFRVITALAHRQR